MTFDSGDGVSGDAAGSDGEVLHAVGVDSPAGVAEDVAVDEVDGGRQGRGGGREFAADHGTGEPAVREFDALHVAGAGEQDAGCRAGVEECVGEVGGEHTVRAGRVVPQVVHTADQVGVGHQQASALQQFDADLLDTDLAVHDDLVDDGVRVGAVDDDATVQGGGEPAVVDDGEVPGVATTGVQDAVPHAVEVAVVDADGNIVAGHDRGTGRAGDRRGELQAGEFVVPVPDGEHIRRRGRGRNHRLLVAAPQTRRCLPDGMAQVPENW